MTVAGRPIKLVVLLQDLEYGGTQRYAIQLLQHLDRNLFAPELWVLRGGTDLLPPAAATGVNVIHLSRANHVGPVALAHLAWRLCWHRPDLLYTLTAVPNIWGRLFAGLLRVPVVSGYRSLSPRQGERLLHRFSRRIITNADALKQSITAKFGIPPERVTVIPNAVDTEVFTPDPTAAAPIPTVVCVARLVPQKGLETLVDAFRLTLAKVPTARLEIIGDGPLRLDLQRRIQEGGLDPAIRILPVTEDVRPHLRRAWVFALASVAEASPNTILEAMATELPVVATSVGGIPDLVVHGETGVLVKHGDPAAFSEALGTLLTDGNRRRTLGAAGRQRAIAHHSLPVLVRQTEQVLLEAVQLGTVRLIATSGPAPLELPLWPADQTEPVAHREQFTERGRFRPDRSVRHVTRPTITVYMSLQARLPSAAVVICPGGGYGALTIDREGHDVARWLTTLGVAGIVLKYRLPHPMPTNQVPWPMQDATRALELVRRHAREWQIDPQRIGLLGFSAGGHVAATIPAKFHILVYPVISMDLAITHRNSRKRLIGRQPTDQLVRQFSLDQQVTSQTPPTLLVHARDDDVVNVANSLRYHEALQRHAIPSEFQLYERGGHGFGLGISGGEVAQWPARCHVWLQAQRFV